MFSDREKVTDFLKGILSPKLLNGLELQSLRQDPNSYIDDRLKDFYSDVVYECQYREEVPLKIAFLFEDKSYSVKYPHFQLLRYMLEMWEQHINKGKEPRLIIPAIIYHGMGIWKNKSFKDYFIEQLPKELHSFVPDFEYILVDLNAKNPEQIREQFRSLKLQVGFLMMKFIRDVNLLERFEMIFEGANELLKNEEDKRYFQQIFVYLHTATKLETEKIMEKAQIISQEAADLVESTAMRLIKQGMEKGAFTNLQDNIGKLLVKNFTVQQVSDMLEAPVSLVEEVANKLEAEGKLP